MPFPEPWPRERVDRFTALWSSTLGASEIASRLGQEFPMARKVSADAVQKKAKSLGLPPRPRTETAIKPRARIAYQGGGFAVLHAGMPRDPTVFREDDLPRETRKLFLDLEWGDCKWPGASGFFCGVPAEPDAVRGGVPLTYRPYCTAHCNRALQGRRQSAQNASGGVAERAA